MKSVVTVTTTVSESLSPSAVTVSLNLSVSSSVRSAGAVKRGLAVSASSSVTDGPPVCRQE